MIKFEKIKPGTTLYDVRKSTTTHGQRWVIYPVFVREVDAENRRVLASWNSNKPEWMSEYRITKYRAGKPSNDHAGA